MRGKILVTGTGRCGTSCMMQLLSKLKLPTGFDSMRHGMGTDYAGQEFIIPPSCDTLKEDYKDIQILKDPRLCWTLRTILEEGTLEIDHVIVMVRNVLTSAESRMKAGKMVGPSDKAPTTSNEQAEFLYESIGHLFETLVLYGVAYTTIVYPRVVKDPRYAYDRLKLVPGLLDGKTYVEFQRGHAAVMRKSRVTVQPPAIPARYRGLRAGIAEEVAKAYNVLTLNSDMNSEIDIHAAGVLDALEVIREDNKTRE